MINQAEESICREFGKKIWTKFRRGVRDYRLISEGDKIAVCISGGKDSILMALCIRRLQRNGEIPFESEYIAMDPGYSNENAEKIKENCKLLDLPVSFYKTNIFNSAERSPKNPCFLCSRLRRGWLYKKAQELGCNKIALGHHFDDVVETFILNLSYEGRLGTFSPVTYLSRKDLTMIRPFVYTAEKD
ncbi:MAG: tRNA 2-thiocytidine biosynthesis protein TtcA, partial [Ruminococcus sp.]|nr:tRNA 2-thiocytidine biosynthesis protein TtcA [Ruminococcus sp.]